MDGGGFHFQLGVCRRYLRWTRRRGRQRLSGLGKKKNLYRQGGTENKTSRLGADHNVEIHSLKHFFKGIYGKMKSVGVGQNGGQISEHNSVSGNRVLSKRILPSFSYNHTPKIYFIISHRKSKVFFIYAEIATLLFLICK